MSEIKTMKEATAAIEKLEMELSSAKNKITGLETEKKTLEMDMSSVQKMRDSAEQQVKELTEKNNHLSANVTIVKEDLTKSETAVRELTKSLEESEEIIRDLRSQLATETSRVEGMENIVEHAGKKYRVKAKSFHYNGKERSASEATTGSELLAELIDIGAGFLEEIQEEDE